MTTKVIVEVPESADYCVAVKTNTPPTRGNHISYVGPGKNWETYLHSGLRIVGIEEVPLSSDNNIDS